MNFLITKCWLKLLIVCFLFISLLLLAGCWDRREVNDLAIVLATGIDKKEDKTIELSVQIIIPSAITQGQGGGGGEGEKTAVLSVQGISIADAMSRLQEKVSRKIFWGHNEVVVFGEEFAREGVREQLDFFARYPTTRLQSYVYVCKGTAGDILEVVPTLELTSGEALRELATLQIGMRVTIKDLLRSLSGDTKAATVPWLEASPLRNGKDEGETKSLRINGTAIFKSDKMVGYIDDKVTRGLLWLRNEIEEATITIFPKNEKEGFVSFYIIRANTELQPQVKNEKWIMNVKIVTEVDVLQNGTNLNAKDPEIVKKFEEKLENDIRNRVMIVLNSVQKEMKVDVFGFADAFHRQFPEKWANVKDRWEDVFPEVEVNIDPKVYVLRNGMSTDPQGLPEEEVEK